MGSTTAPVQSTSPASTTTNAATQPAGGAPGGTAQPPATTTNLRAGAAAVDITPPIGVPLGGFGEGARRRFPPDLNPNNYHAIFNPSTGVKDPIMCKALVLEVGQTTVAILTLDLVATTGSAVRKIQRRAAQLGVNIPIENIMAVSSHTHSGPGTITPLHFWELVAMDFHQPQVERDLLNKCADALVQAYQNLGPAVYAADSTQVFGITKNRRARDSNVFTRSSIDPELGVIRIDRPNGTPVATVWNYAVHGLIYWDDNMEYSADLMGHVAGYVEAGGGGVCLFANGAEGDINPDGRGAVEGDRLGQQLAQEILTLRSQMTTTGTVNLQNRSEYLDLGAATIAVDINRIGRSNSGASWIRLLQNIPGVSLGIGIPLGGSWLEHRFRFQAIRLNDVIISSIPGEAIHTVGLAVKAHGAAKGYRKTFVFGLANGHMAYITTTDEFDAGGYESIATFFGRHTGDMVIGECTKLIDILR